MVGRVCPRHGYRGRPLNSIVRSHQMRLCNIQLHLQRAPSLDMPQIKRVVGRVSRRPGVVRRSSAAKGYDRGPYVNFTFETDDVVVLWSAIQAEVLGDREIGPAIAKATIITCQGERGWDDYLLLHHYDRRVKLDEADEI